MKNSVIAIDLDEVLSPFVSELMKWYNLTHQTNLQFEQFITYDFTQIWGGTREECANICNTFHETRNIEELLPIENSFEALSTLKKEHKLVLVTSRPLQHFDYTHAWINRHFPNIFSDIILCNHWTSQGQSIKKSEACQKVGAQYFVDDLPHYVEEVAKCEIKSFLFGDYPWNQNIIPHHQIQRVTGWGEIVKFFELDLDKNKEKTTS